MLSRPEVYGRLRDGFAGVLFDFFQGQHYKGKVGVHLGTGDQLLLDPQGTPIPTGKVGKEGRPVVVYGRHGLDTTPEVLDGVLAKHPAKPGSVTLKPEWFFFPASYPWPNPARIEAVAQYTRTPIAVVEGPVPATLENSDFLRWHVRQFLWARGKADGPGRILVRRVKDGLKEGAATELASIDSTLPAARLGEALDAAWLAYMKERPFTARGYHENPHGRWMRGVKDQMIGEDESIRRQAVAGTLLPPGRKAGEKAPY